MGIHEKLEAEMKKANADRPSGILRVTSPHCQFVNWVPEFAEIDVFICDECGEPVDVEEPVQSPCSPLEIRWTKLAPTIRRMRTLVVVRVSKGTFKIQSVDRRTQDRQSSRTLTEDELRSKLAEDFGKSLVEIDSLIKSANDQSPI